MHHRVNIKIFRSPDCGKEFSRKFNMESHRIVNHGDANSEADSEESFDHGTEASDEHDSSDEQHMHNLCNMSVMQNLCYTHALDRVRFLYIFHSWFYRWSGDHGAVQELGRFGCIRMVWCLWPGIKMYHLDSCLNCMGWLRCGKIEHPPLILTVFSGRKRAHLNNSSQTSSPYLNWIGWQDKPTVEQLLCRWCLVLPFLAVAIWTLVAVTIWPVHHFDVSFLAVKYRLLMICTLHLRHHTFLTLSKWPPSRTALSLSLGR